MRAPKTVFLLIILFGTSALARDSRPEFVPGEVLVRFRDLSSIAAKTATAESPRTRITVTADDGRDITVEVERFLGSDVVRGLRVAQVPPQDTLLAIEALQKRPDVVYAEPNYIVRIKRTPNDPRFPEQWNLKNTGQPGFNDFTNQSQPGVISADVEAEAAWDITTGDPNIVVGIVDTGIDINHQDLRDNIWVNPNETAGDNIDNDNNGFIDDVNGWDFHSNDRTVFDSASSESHGTHVAGTIGAKGNNGIGVTGINWDIRLMSLKVIGPAGTGSTANIIKAYAYAKLMRDRGINIRVLNNSYGGPGKSQAAIDTITELNISGILFVAAAGNEAADNFSFPHYPSNYDIPNIIGVAATDRFDQLWIFSNFGARLVSMGAPGRSILSTTPNNFYASFNGTSMAAPHVAGAAALALAANPNLTPQQMRGVVAFNGDILPMLTERTTTGRRLNIFASLLAALENDTTPPAEARELRIVASNGRSVALSWVAPGDDGNAGTAADYDFFFVSDTTGGKILMPSFIYPAAAGTPQTAIVDLPFRNLSGSIELRTWDNNGNFSTTSIPVSLNLGVGNDPYILTTGPAEPVSTGGTGLNLKGDDRYHRNFALPFIFPFHGRLFSTVTISTNGALYFSNPPTRDAGLGSPEEIGADAGSTIEGLTGQTMIAGMWDDLRTDIAPAHDIFVVQPDPNRIIFRWEGVTFDTPIPGGNRGENPILFEIELRSDGTIIFRYGAGQTGRNQRLFPVVGISAGEPDAYVVQTHTSETELIDLINAPTVTFTPRPTEPSGLPRRRGVGR